MQGTAPDPLATALLIGQLAATSAMLGLIWFVQRVHYPLFGEVGRDGFARYEQRHVARTGPVVGPPMLLEAGCAAALLVVPAPGVPAGAAWLGAGLLAAIWLATASLQVPCHRVLSVGFDGAVHRRLVASNWIRTIGWTLRGALAAWMLWAATAG